MQRLLEWIRDNKGKSIALIIACFYLIISKEDFMWLRALGFLAIALAMIFFSDAIGDYIGFVGWRYVSKKSPGFIVAIVGWILLLLPLIIILFVGRE